MRNFALHLGPKFDYYHIRQFGILSIMDVSKAKSIAILNWNTH